MSSEEKRIPTISDPDTDRYANLHLIKWWDQEMIRRSRIMVVGAGALGNEVLKNLALLGVGHVLIVDFDCVAATNLTRSVLFRAQDGGQSKAEVAARRVCEINPNIVALPLHANVLSEVGLGIYRRMDVIIGCLDNRAARIAVNRACQTVQKTWIDGALDTTGGLVRTFVPADNICYECTLSQQDYALLHLRYSCPPGFAPVEGTLPTLPTNASIIAAMQVQEAIKLLHKQPVQSGQAVYYIGETLNTFHMRYSSREDCPAHGAYEPIIALSNATNLMTVAECMALVRQHLPSAEALYLPSSIVKAFYCSHCKKEAAIYSPYNQETLKRVPCPECGGARQPIVVGAVTDRADVDDITLRQFGVPALDILPVHTPDGWSYVEFSGDEYVLLNKS